MNPQRILRRNKGKKHDIQDKNDFGKEEIYTSSIRSNDLGSNMNNNVVCLSAWSNMTFLPRSLLV